MGRESNAIDREKLRAAVRKLGNDYVRYMLDDAIDLLPPAKLHKIAKKYLDLKRLRPDADKTAKTGLLPGVRLFEKASLAGEYYESFAVNSRNSTQKSAGTSTWIAAFRRLLDRCVADTKKEDPAEVREAMDILFVLWAVRVLTREACARCAWTRFTPNGKAGCANASRAGCVKPA